MAHATRRPRATWIVGLGGALGAALLWACSSHSAPAVLGDGDGTDAAQQPPLPDASVVDTSTPAEGAASACPLVEGGCASVPSCGKKVNVTRVAQTPPVAAGGTVVPGTYVMTDLTIFTGTGGATGATGQWFNETQYLSLAGDGGAGAEGGAGNTGEAGAPDDDGGDAGIAVEAGPGSQVFQLLDVTESSSGPATTLTGTSTFAAPDLSTIVYGCPSTAPIFQTVYTSTPTTLQLFATESAGVGVITYTKM